MRSHALCWLMLAMLAGPVMAEETASGWPSGSAMDTGSQEVKRRDHALQQLKKKHKTLVRLIHSYAIEQERIIPALESAHQAWLNYYPTPCALAGAISGSGGSWPGVYALRCEISLLDTQLRTVSDAISCIKKLPADTRSFDSEHCLTPLAANMPAM